MECRKLRDLPAYSPTPLTTASPDSTPSPQPTPQKILTPNSTFTPTVIPTPKTCKSLQDELTRTEELDPSLIECLSPKIPNVMLVHQQSFPLEINQSIGLRIDGISLSSKRFAAAHTQTLEEMLAASPEDIRSTLILAQEEIPGFRLTTSNLIVIDIENELHPRYWYALDSVTKFRVMSAYKLRLEVARELMPNAFLVAYGFPTPNGKGSDTLAQLSSFVEAGKYGVFDSIDAVMPALHFRFGPGESGHESSLDIQEAAVMSATNLTKSNGRPIDVVPLLSFRINNGQSAFNNQIVEPLVTAMQLAMLQRYSGQVSRIVFWSASAADVNVVKHIQEAFVALPDILKRSEFISTMRDDWEF